jgi:Domain of unknown function (DUF4375)
MFKKMGVTTIDEIFKLPSETDIILKLSEIIWKKTKNSDDNFSNLTEAEKVFIFIDILEGQIINGGFDQFFFNSSGDYTYEALSAYKVIGANKSVEIINRAIEHFPLLPVPKDNEKRRIILRNLDEQISEYWDKLDTEFYKYQENTGGLLIAYLKKNKTQIG